MNQFWDQAYFPKHMLNNNENKQKKNTYLFLEGNTSSWKIGLPTT